MAAVVLGALRYPSSNPLLQPALLVSDLPQQVAAVLGRCSDAGTVIARGIAASTHVGMLSLLGPVAVAVSPSALGFGLDMRLEVLYSHDFCSPLTACRKEPHLELSVHSWIALKHLPVCTDPFVDRVSEALAVVEWELGRGHPEVLELAAEASSSRRLSASSEVM